MSDERVPAIFEAAFEDNNIRVRVDVVERLADGTWRHDRALSAAQDIRYRLRNAEFVSVKDGILTRKMRLANRFRLSRRRPCSTIDLAYFSIFIRKSMSLPIVTDLQAQLVEDGQFAKNSRRSMGANNDAQ
jgi:hypothetical protein